MKIYVASSWRNKHQPQVVAALRAAGHEVYDYRHPEPGNEGFAWSEIDPGWQQWSTEQFREALDHPVAQHGYSLDFTALWQADAVVLVLPCGRSAHLEMGYGCGAGKHTVVYSPERHEPELMYKLCTLGVVATMTELLGVLEEARP